MPDGPVQVVLNPQSFREDRRTPQGGGAGKDFYRDLNESFATHRDTIVRNLRSILASDSARRWLNLAVQMRPDALAKSHRPFRSLFAPSRASHVGTAKLGELIFAVSRESLPDIIALIERAETEVMWRRNAKGESVYSPSQMRSETSAIDSIREWDPSEERGFTLDEADDWVRQGAGRLVVDLFEVPTARKLVSPGRQEQTLIDAWISQEVETGTLALAGRTSESSRIERRPQSHPTTAGSDVRAAIEVAEQSALVKRVRLEDAVEPVDGDSGTIVDPQPAIPAAGRQAAAVVGVIDGGVSGPFQNSAVWVAGRTGLIAEADRGLTQVNHGTSIASLVALGSVLNPNLLPPEEDCRVFDLDLFPDPPARASYYGSLDDFLGEVEESVRRARDESGVRVFNLSYNLRRAPGGAPYSLAAEGLDRIATQLDVIFVISVGNLPLIEEREEWPPRTDDVFAMLARYRGEDALAAPADSLTNVSVAAINPPGMALAIPSAPTRYTRRGANVPSAVKPDFAAYGGGTPGGAGEKSGLFGINALGELRDLKGTSYAAPVVARYLATLDQTIAGNNSRELLLALATHSAKLPAAVSDRRLADIVSSFVGRGVLPSVAETLDGNEHQISIVLSDVIAPGKCIELPFTWPASLVTDEGRCRGSVRLTLAAQPIVSVAHGWERVRVNLDGALKQADEEGRFSSQLEATHQFFTGFTYANERTLSTELGKWYPIKSYRRAMPRGIGKSADWRLDINYLTRAGVDLPEEGVRFAAVLTIEDPKSEAPVYEEMRASLSSIGVSLSDLRTAVRVGVST